MKNKRCTAGAINNIFPFKVLLFNPSTRRYRCISQHYSFDAAKALMIYHHEKGEIVKIKDIITGEIFMID